MRERTCDTLVSRLSDYERAVEIGIGRRSDVAEALATTEMSVAVTDIRRRTVSEPVEFYRDDITDPDLRIYADADVVYALNLPPELHRPTATLARSVAADCLFTTLGGDPPLVPVSRETVPGDTLFRVRTHCL